MSPFFDFRCPRCQNVFEKLISIREVLPSDSPDNPLCPKCGSVTQRMVSEPGRAKVPGGTQAGKRAW